MMDEESVGVELDLREAIAWCFMGVGAFSLVNGLVWMVLRTMNYANSDGLVGAEGLIVTSVLLIAMGAFEKRRVRRPTVEVASAG